MIGLLTGKTAIVTGGGRGIGRGIALALGRAGANVIVNDFGASLDGSASAGTPADGVVSAIEKSGAKALAHVGSVASFADCESMVALAESTFGDAHILVHCAGILRDRMVFNMTEDEWDSVIAVHLKGAFNLVHAMSKRFRKTKTGGRIICMSSDSAYGAAAQPNYAAAKAGILGLTWSCAEALKRYGATANAVIPSGATRMIDAKPESKEIFEKTGKWPSELAIGTEKDPDNVAPLVTYLASDAAAYVNGQAFFSQGYSYSRVAQPSIDSAIRKSEAWTVEELMKVFPKTLGDGLAPPFASEMLDFVREIPAESWTTGDLGQSVWRKAGG
jgi:NAD(P)-dependent dehydrogenase (short-subunit alcohol dehydrogenase family)